MRKSLFAGCIALLAFGVSACQVELQPVDEANVAEPGAISCTMSATMPEFKPGGDPETKSSLESVVRVKWKKDDALSVINLTTGKQLGGCIKANKDGANTTFSPSGLNGSITAGDKLVFLLDNDPSRRSASEKDFEPFTMDYSSQKGNSNEVPIVVYANYTATANGTINAVNPEFNFLMGYVQLAVSALPASTSVTQMGIENLNTKCHFSISGNSFVTTPQNGNITLSEAFTANSKGTNTRYFSCFTSPSQGVARNAHINANSQSHVTAWLKAALSAGYYYQAVATGFTNENISFVDDTFKSYCVSHYDKNGDGEVSFAEAAAVTEFSSFTAAEKAALKEVFELPYFFKGERLPDFEGCTALKQILLPGTLQAIQENAFKGCTSIEEITIPSNVASVGEGAFEGCTSLERFNGTMASTDRRYLVKDNHVLAFAPAGLEETTIPNGVTTIDAGVFANNTTIKTVYLSAELTSVEARAFKGCTALPIIRFRSNIASIGEEAFKGCSSLRSVYSDAVTPPSVGTDAFANCHAQLAAHVTSGNLAAYSANPAWSALNVTSAQPWNEIWYTTTDGNVCEPNLLYASFDFKKSLLSNTYVDNKGVIVFSQDITDIVSFCFRGQNTLLSVNLPDCLQSISGSAFGSCTSLVSINLPDAVTTIGNSAFSGCSSLASITLSDNLQSIGNNAFWNCTSLVSINLPDAVTTIGYSAFDQCYSLASVTLSDNLQSIGNNAFSNCSSLNAVHANPTVFLSISFENYHSNPLSFGRYLYTKGPNPELVTSIVIPEGTTSIPKNAYYGCISLTNLSIPSTVQSIGENALSYTGLTYLNLPNSITSIPNSMCHACVSLTSVSLPENLLSIGNDAFTQTGLEAITIPASVTEINDAFGAPLRTVYFKSITPPTFFNRLYYCTSIYVPTAAVDTYKDAWPSIAPYITGYDFE